MKHRTRAVVALILISFLGYPVLGALDTRDIDKVIKKEVLDQQDLAVIDRFVAAGIDELLNTKDFGSVGNLRNEIVARAHSSQASADIQYNPQFISAAAKNLDRAFNDAKKMPDSNVRPKVMLNLMILLDSLNSPQLIDVALEMLDNENTAVRYWAVHAVTNSGITEQFNSGKASSAIASRVIDRLRSRIGSEKSPYIISQIAQFGTTLKVPKAQELLYSMADIRLKKYQTWTVDDILLDVTVLKLLADRTAGQDKAASWRFGQLFSYAMEYYLKSKGVLENLYRDQLASVLMQTEGDSFTKLGIPQSGIRKAIEKKDEQALLAEYKTLFGDAAAPGKFTTTFNVSYQNPDGTNRQTPLPLPEKPKPAT